MEINWGMIGCGSVSELKSGPAFSKVPHSKLLAVMRRNLLLAKDYALRHNVKNYYSDATELLNNPKINAVYVATPPDTHATYAIQAMKAGKAVYVEKPMARTYAECLEMISVSEETGMPLHVAYYRRTLPAFLKVKELVESNAIGKPLTVNVKLHKPMRESDKTPENQSWHLKPEISGAGYFYDLASHQFDYLDFLFGPITSAQGIASNIGGYYEVEDTVSAIFTFASGVVGSGSWCFVVDKNSEEDYIEIKGTAGEITFSTFNVEDVILKTKDKTEAFSIQNPENIQFNLINQLVQSLRTGSECVSTMYSAARTSQVIEQIVKDYYSHRKAGIKAEAELK